LEKKRALDGIRVIDLSHVLAAPTATMMLGDLGAEIIHVEPPQGDDAREYGPYIGQVDIDHSGYFISLNRNKKSLVLNLKHPQGEKILSELIKVADVLVENYRPGTLKDLGFSWDDMQGLNPRIIYASISGFGHDTLPEYASRPSYDIVAQAYSGLMSITGPENGPPCRVGSSIGDIIAGHQAVIGILAALYSRKVTGRGQYYDGSMVDGLFSILENAVMRYTVNGEIAEPLGTAHPTITPFEAIQTRDSWLVIPIGNDKMWARFCAVLGCPDLSQDARFKTNNLRSTHRKELSEILNQEMKKKRTAEWIVIFDTESLPYSPINNIQQICDDPYIKYRQMLVEIDQPGIGKMKVVGSPIRLSENPGEVYAGAPLLGQHTEEILGGLLKMTQGEIETLRKEGVIK
jgi:CoA:oxalate CoA-transferase